jgi:hypothetical protein
MRAILIDPAKRSISEVDVVVGDDVEIQKILRCDSFKTGVFRRLNGSLETGGDTLLVDDSYLRGYAEYRDDPPFWFQVDRGTSPPTSAAIPVRSLVIGYDRNGYHTDARISLEELTKRIIFMPRS